MRQLAVSFLALALGVAAALALASCGGEDAKLLPGATAAEISENLDTVKQLASEGECVGAANAADQVSTQIGALSGVDPKLKQALERGAARLNEVVATCEEGEVETETVAPTREATEEEAKAPPGQEKKEGREREREESEAEKNVPTTPTETTPSEPPPTTTPSEGGGTGAPGGVSPATPAPENE